MYVLVVFHMQKLQKSEGVRTVYATCTYSSVSDWALFYNRLFTFLPTNFSFNFLLAFKRLNLALFLRNLYKIMGNNTSIDKLVVQKLFEMHAAGDSAAKIAEFFHRTTKDLNLTHQRRCTSI